VSALSEEIGRIAHAFDANDSRRVDIRALALRVFDLDEQNARLEEARYLDAARLLRVARAVQQQLAEEAENYVEDADLEGLAPRDEVSAIGIHLRAVDVEAIVKETP
jgi:cell division septum initiation protein DivIVA